MQVDGINFYDRPVPGESLTVEPKSRPYERPPEMSDMSDVLGYYLDVMYSKEFIDNIVQLLDVKCPVEVIVNAITMQNVIEGRHSVHTRLLISPILHEYLKLLATQADIEYVDNLDTRDMSVENRKQQNSRVAKRIESELLQIKEGSKEDDGGVELMRQTAKMLATDQATTENIIPLGSDEIEKEEQEEQEMDVLTEDALMEELPTQGLMEKRGE